MGTVDYLAGEPEAVKFFANPANASAYVTALTNRSANLQAGGQYAQGNYGGAANTLARSGNIQDAEAVQASGAKANEAGFQYLSHALPIFAKIAKLHEAEGPQAQGAAIAAAFDHIAPEAKQLTGVSDQTLMALRQSFATDPVGTIERLHQMVPTEYKGVGGVLYGIQGNDVVSQYQPPQRMRVGNDVVEFGGAGASSPQAPPGAATPTEQAPVQSGTDLLAPLDPQTTAQVESGGDPNAVSPAGASGTMQTMPSTLRDPGYGVTPAQNDSHQERQRVGADYLGAMGHQFGNPVYQAIAYNWGPGNTQKWLQAGAHWDQLPRETRDYLGRTALAQVAGRQPQNVRFAGAGASLPAFAPGSPGAQLAQQMSGGMGGQGQQAQAQPQQPQGGGRVLYHGGPEVTPIGQAPASVRAAYPGASAIKSDGTPIYPPANVANNMGADTLEPPDSHSQSILAATGLPYAGFLTLTGQASKLPKDATTRRAAFKAAEDFANKRGVDVSTFASQYEAQNEVLQSNLKRYNQTSVMEGEIRGTIANLKPVADAVGMDKVRIVNVLKAAAGKEVSDPTVMQYAFQLQQLRAEIAGYNGALQGRTGNNITEQDMREADNVIRNGLNSGGAAGLDKAVQSATQKMSGVLENRIRLTNRAVWQLFGVGQQYDRLHPAPKPPAQQKPQNSANGWSIKKL